MTRLVLRLFGGLEATLDEAPVTAFESVKERALLAYLSTEADRPQQREALAGLLWPDWPQQSAIRNLRNTLVHLRQNIGDREASAPFLLVTRESIQLNREADARVDVSEFVAAISEQGSATRDQGTGGRGQGGRISDRGSAIRDQGLATRDRKSKIYNLKSSIALYRGPFLDGFPSTDSAPFEEWVLARREYFSQQMLKALGRLAEWSLEQGEYEQAEGYARRQIELEPWRETAYQQLMRSLSLKGERAQSLAQFESLKKALQRELSAEPSQETFQLYRSIRDEAPEGLRDDNIQGIGDKGKGEQGSAIRDQRTATGDQQSIIYNLKSTIYNSQSAIPSRQANNLPIQLTSFIGREKEIAAVRRLLAKNRLVTLTGPGGTGKTRLSLQTVAGLVDQFADGVWLVELAPLSDPALVPTLTARVLGLRELTGPQVAELLQEYLEPRQLLLILDNCEHVIEACTRLAAALLKTCPRLFILTSSREALGIPGEVPFRVPPLTLPEYGMTQVSPPFDALGQYESIRLFVERAATASPSFTLTPANAPAVMQICQRLDGIPLAIELAAARVRLLQVTEIAGRLDDRFRLLTGGSRLALPRYQTLRASIDWSYELLSPPERGLLQRLSVFAGGWALEAAETVGCDDFPSPTGREGSSEARFTSEARFKGEGIQSCDVLELLGLLVDKSLVNAGSGPGEITWYRMLETIRQYAHEKLVEAGQAEAARQCHLQYYLELSERLGGKVRSPDQVTIVDRLEAELDNLRLALAWSLEGKGKPGWDPEPGLRLAAALWWFCWCADHLEEGLQWLEQLLAAEVEERGDGRLTPERTRCRAKALMVVAMLARINGEINKAAQASAESRALYQSLGARGRVGYAWACWAYAPSKNPTENIRIYEEALAIMREAGDRLGEGEILDVLGEEHLLRCNEYERAKMVFDENLALRKEIGDREGLAGAMLDQSFLAEFKGDIQQAHALVEKALEIATDVKSIIGLRTMYRSLCYYEILAGDYEQAAGHAREMLSFGRRQGRNKSIRWGLHYLGQLALLQGDTQKAREAFEEYLDYYRKKDHKLYIQEAQIQMGDLAWSCGDIEQAGVWYTEAVNTARNLITGVDPFAWIGLGKVALARSELPQASAYFQRAFGTPNLGPNEYRYMQEAVTFFAAARGQDEIACRLFGATDTWYTKNYYSFYPYLRQEREACIAALRVRMEPPAFTAAWAEGQVMTQEQAIQLAKEAIDL